MGDSTKSNNVLNDRFPERKSEEINLRSDLEKIILFLQGKTPNAVLSPALEEKLTRLKQTAALISRYGGARSVIPMLEEMYTVSYATARRLFIEAQEAFAETSHFNRQFHVETYMEMLLDGLAKSKTAGDFKAYSSMLKEYKTAIKDLMGDAESEMYRTLQVPDFQVGFFPEELNVKLPKNYKAILRKLQDSRRADEIEDAIVISSDEENSL